MAQQPKSVGFKVGTFSPLHFFGVFLRTKHSAGCYSCKIPTNCEDLHPKQTLVLRLIQMLLIGNPDIYGLIFVPKFFFSSKLNLSLFVAAPAEKEFGKDDVFSQEFGLVWPSDVYSLDHF